MTFEELRREITVALRVDPARARRLAGRYARLAERDGTAARRAEAIVQTAKVDHVTGRLAKAVDGYRRARSIFLRERLTRDAATTDISAVQALALLGRGSEVKALNRRLRRFRGDALLRARAELATGSAWDSLGDETAAEECFRRALRLLRDHGEIPESARARLNLGVRLARRGAVREALAELERAFAFFAADPRDGTFVIARHNRAWARGLAGETVAALEDLRAAQQEFAARGDERRAALALLDEAEMALRLGAYEPSARDAREAARRLRRAESPVESARALATSARARRAAGRAGEARREAESARKTFRAAGDEAGVAHADLIAGRDLARAEATLRRRGHWLHALDALVERAGALGGARGARLLAGRAKSYPALLRRWLLPRIHLLAAEGAPARRIDLLRKAVRAAEDLRATAPTGGLRAGTLSAHLEAYESLARALLERGRPEDRREAFLVLDAARARTLREEMGRESPALFETPRTRELRERLETLWKTLESREGGPGDLRAASLGLLRSVTRCERDLVRAMERGEGAAAGNGAGSASPSRPCAAWAALGPDLVGLLWRDGEVTTWTCGPIAALRGDLDAFRFQVTRHLHGSEDTTVALDLLRRLARLLPPPEALAGCASLRVVLPAEIADVPVEALPWQGEPLFRSMSVVHAPTAAGDGLAAPSLARPLLVGIDDTALPEVAAELADLQALLPEATVLRGESRDAILQAMEGRGVVHIAGHARARADLPLLSALRVRDGWLTAADLQSGRLGGALVVLSACRSGDPSLLWRGEAMGGFPRALLAAGASAVVASRWELQDRVARAWMREFYGRVGLQGPEMALAEAAAAVRETFPHPAAWTAFLVVSSGRLGRR